MKIKNICCIGAGYVGGPTMAVIADKCPNIQINVVDINQQRINDWNNIDLQKLPIFEPGLDKIISRCRGKNLHFSTAVELNISKADLIFISVNTPTKTQGHGAGQASDLKWVDASARKISQYAKGETIVVEKSTLPVKTAETIKKILHAPNKINDQNSLSSTKFYVLSNPEFLAEGSAINDLINPDRVLIGGDDPEAISALCNIYKNWIEESKIITTNLWSSELSKLIANAFLAQRISSINSVTALCEATGANISEVALAVGSDSRIGTNFLKPGPGFGGSCFKKDILNLVYICKHYGLNEVADYWQGVLNINNWQKKRISQIINEKLFGTIAGKKIGILGFAFKANTNDTRESPAISICQELLIEGAKLAIFDERVSYNQIEHDLKGKEHLDKYSIHEKSWTFTKDILELTKNADAIIILTESEKFKSLDWEEISKNMRSPSWLFDTRGIVDTKEAIKYKINVWSVGSGELIKKNIY